MERFKKIVTGWKFNNEIKHGIHSLFHTSILHFCRFAINMDQFHVMISLYWPSVAVAQCIWSERGWWGFCEIIQKLQSFFLITLNDSSFTEIDFSFFGITFPLDLSWWMLVIACLKKVSLVKSEVAKFGK